MTFIMPNFPRRSQAPASKPAEQPQPADHNRGPVVVVWRDGERWKFQQGAGWQRMADTEPVKQSTN